MSRIALPFRRLPWIAGLTAGILSAALPRTGLAAWPTDGLAVCTEANSQNRPGLIGTGNGALIAWTDSRVGVEDVYAHFVDSTGTLRAGPDILVASAASWQNAPQLAADGAGGAFVAWTDHRSGSSYDLYAQRVSSAGIPQWTANGVPVVTATGHQRFHVIAPDGLVDLSGGLPGVYLAWQDDRSGTGDIYAQHLTTNGVRWANEVPVCAATGAQTGVVATPDGVSSTGTPAGLVLAWIDGRGGTTTDIYAQRLSPAGVPQWTAGGRVVGGASGNQNEVKIANIGQSYFVVWRDLRGANGRIYAQKLDVNGNPLWAANGVEVGPAASGLQSSPAIARSSDGSVIVAWTDSRNGNWNIYAQRLDTNGVPLWTPGGIPVCTAPGDQMGPVMTVAGTSTGGVMVAWTDERYSADGDLFAHRIEASGAMLWPVDGIRATTATGIQTAPRIISDGRLGAIVAWTDERAGNSDIYAMRLAPNTVLDAPGATGRSFRMALRSANPSRGAVRFALDLERSAEVAVDVFDLSGRRVSTVARGERREAGTHELIWSGRDDANADVPAGVYLVRTRAGSDVATLKVVRVL